MDLLRDRSTIDNLDFENRTALGRGLCDPRLSPVEPRNDAYLLSVS
jgi:hypothetical protein